MSDNYPPLPGQPDPQQPGPPYGQPAYGQQQYGQPGYSQPTYGAAPTPYGGYATQQGSYASWGDRVKGWLWDVVYMWPGYALMLAAVVLFVVGAITGTDESGEMSGFGVTLMLLGGVVYFAAFIAFIWLFVKNYILDQGRTGYTYGKRKVGIRLLVEATGQPVGAGMAFVRYLLHSLISQVFLIDYLWPLWDAKSQTLTDKILSTVVILQPDAGQADHGQYGVHAAYPPQQYGQQYPGQ